MGGFEVGRVFEAESQSSVDGDVGDENEAVVEKQRDAKVETGEGGEDGGGVGVDGVVEVGADFGVDLVAENGEVGGEN